MRGGVSVGANERRRQARLGEWAVLGVLYDEPTHGWAVARRLRPETEVGRVWSLSRALTYRALDTLCARGLIEPTVSEPSAGGPNRTIVTLTAAGRVAFQAWVATPVEHLRDVRSELLLKLVLAARAGLDTTDMLRAQLDIVRAIAARQVGPADDDPVGMWRYESAQAALRFLDRLTAPTVDHSARASRELR